MSDAAARRAGGASPSRHLAGLAETARRTADTLAPDIAAIAELVIATLAAGGKLMFCGNGGSAADAQHLATEYVVRFRRTVARWRPLR
jgi:phosphoheptose isomerase